MIVSADDVEATKPAPDVVLSGIERSGASPSDVVVIGDTPYDVKAAIGARAPAIALRCGGWWSDEHLAGAVAIYDDPAALAERLESSPLARA
jgi:phosphoglycolate phosphatase-like HAD superfamily hydrolase